MKDDILFFVDNTSGRLHTNLTQLKTKLRKFVRYDGKVLYSIDLTNSQPFLLQSLLEAELFIKKDLELYNCMLHKAFKICFDRAYKDVTYSETDQRMIKSFYGTSDYFPLSAIYEAKALVKSLKCLEKENQDMIKTRLKKIDVSI